MQAVVCHSYGLPEILCLEDIKAPECGPGQVRINVQACGLNFPDALIIQGKYQFKPEPPFIPGVEVAGVIEAIGEQVDGLAPGDRVVALPGIGGFAEQVVTEPGRVFAIPDSMDFVSAAGFAMTYGTSMHALKQRGKLAPGETLLVLGAGGGVGLAAVDIGRAMGARVIAAAGSEEKLEAARKCGAHEFINYREEPLRERVKALTDGRGADVIYDAVGGDFFDESLRCIAWNGRILVVGFASGRIPQVPANLPLLKGSSIVGVFWGRFRDEEPEANRANFKELCEWYEHGNLRPFIGRVETLSNTPKAMNALLQREVVGKLVLEVI